MDFLLGRKKEPEFEMRNAEHCINIGDANGDYFGFSNCINETAYKKFIEQYCLYKDSEDLIFNINTRGGSLTFSMLIARIIAAHKGKTTAIITRFAFSGGTVIALACDRIEMTRYAALGSIDPQMSCIGSFRHAEAPLKKAALQDGWIGLISGEALALYMQTQTEFDKDMHDIMGARWTKEMKYFFTERFTHGHALLRTQILEVMDVGLFEEEQSSFAKDILERMRTVSEKQSNYSCSEDDSFSDDSCCSQQQDVKTLPPRPSERETASRKSSRKKTRVRFVKT